MAGAKAGHLEHCLNHCACCRQRPMRMPNRPPNPPSPIDGVTVGAAAGEESLIGAPWKVRRGAGAAVRWRGSGLGFLVRRGSATLSTAPRPVFSVLARLPAPAPAPL